MIEQLLRVSGTIVTAVLLLATAVVSSAMAAEPSSAEIVARLQELERQNAELAARNESLARQSDLHSRQLNQFGSRLERLPELEQPASGVGGQLISSRYNVSVHADPAAMPPTELQAEIEKLGAGLEALEGGAKELEGGVVKLKAGVEELAANLRITTLDSEIKIGVFGFLRGEMLLSDARPLIASAPFFLTPDTGLDQDTVNVHGKSSAIGAGIEGPCICGRESGGLILVYFFGDTALGNSTGVFLAQAYGELKSDHDRLAFGVQADVFNPVNPTVLNWGMYCGAGNTGFLRGQLRYERFYKPADDVQWTLTGALSNPVPTVLSTFDEVTLAENNGWPNVEGRLALGIGCEYQDGLVKRRPLEIGVSGLVGEIRTTTLQAAIPPATRQVNDVWGAGCDLQLALTDRCGCRGELYTGKGMGTYAGAIVQLLNLDTLDTIQSSGGWGEVYYYWNDCLHSHVGYGLDDPRNGDVTLGQRTRNEAVFANLIWDVTKNFQVGFEVSHWRTDYRVQPNPLLDRFALGDKEGEIYHVRFQYAF